MKYPEIMKTILVISILVGLSSSHAHAYEKSDHVRINEYIADSAVNDFSLSRHLRDYLGFQGGASENIAEKQWILSTWFGDIQLTQPETLTVRDCLGKGGMDEDTPLPRCERHFHNPLKDWNEAGWLFGVCDSSILWAQLPDKTQSWGDYRWQDVRSYYYTALTSADPVERASNFVLTFNGLGRLMHLIQDASVPAHVRNDFHMLYSFEKFVNKLGESRDPEIQNIYSRWLSDNTRYDYNEALLNLDANPLAPIPIARIVDSDRYTDSNPEVTIEEVIGLSEYTNINFFSRDTIFKTTAFPYPNWDSVGGYREFILESKEDERAVGRQYFIKEHHGDTGYRLCTVPMVHMYIPEGPYLEFAQLDDNVYQDYAERLVPRAVSYSAGLLKYFFRGTLDISYTLLPSHEMVVSVKNTSVSNGAIEEIGPGTVRLVIKYKSPVERDYQYYVSEEQAVQSIPGDSHETFTFHLGSHVPIYYEDSTISIVFQGKLGAENDAVCVGTVKPFHYNSIDITVPDQGVYSFLSSAPSSPETEGFNHITLMARNVSENEEPMTAGSIDLVVEYRVSDVDPFKNYDLYNYPPSSPHVHYIETSLDARSDHAIPRAASIQLDFDLPQDIPLWATDVYLYVVYKGAFGNEEESVCVGFMDVSEPTPVSIVNATDMLCINDTWYDASDPVGLEAARNIISESATTYWYNYWCDEIEPVTIHDMYIRFSPIGNYIEASSDPSGHIYRIPLIEAGRYKSFYVLSENMFCCSMRSESFSTEARSYTCGGLINQTRYNPELELTARNVPIYSTYRGLDMWGEARFTKWFEQLCFDENGCSGCTDESIAVTIEPVD